jgi:tRNA-dihydrouridine synthase
MAPPRIPDILPPQRPLLLLAPMQDVTDLPFWRVLHRYGGPDVYFTEYFRVHPTSTPEKHILSCIRENPAQRPVLAQMIGQDIPALLRTAAFLQKLPILGIDLNCGCPAPIVCRKNSGGGLLREHGHLKEILLRLRDTITTNFTVKTRLGFADPDEIDRLLELYAGVPINALTVHGRTVREMYRSEVHYDRIARAVRAMPCPVFANGNILGVGSARSALASTGAAGLMIGRGCIRNPWIFEQIRQAWAGRPVMAPTLRDVRDYIGVLYQETRPPGLPEQLHVAKMKKYMHFIAQNIGPEDRFVQEIRRAGTEAEFFAICDRHLDRDGLFHPEPPSGALVNAGNPRTDCYG